MHKIQQARNAFIVQFGFVPNCILVSFEDYTNINLSDHVLDMRVIICDDVAQPTAALIPIEQ